MKSKRFTLGLLIFYLLALTWIIIFKLQFSFENLPHIKSINLIPFGQSVVVNMHVLWEETSLPKQFIPIICTSLIFEIVQFIFAIGASDITDIISNSSGGIAGIAIAVFISKVSRTGWIKFINIISFIGAIILTLFIAILLLANM